MQGFGGRSYRISKDAENGRGLRILEMSMALLLCRQESKAGEGGRPKVRDVDVSLTNVGEDSHSQDSAGSS